MTVDFDLLMNNRGLQQADAVSIESSMYPDNLNATSFYFGIAGTAQWFVPPPDCRSIHFSNDAAVWIRQDYTFPVLPGTSSTVNTNITAAAFTSTAAGGGATANTGSTLIPAGERMLDVLPGIPITIIPANSGAVANIACTPWRPRKGYTPYRTPADPTQVSPYRIVGQNGRLPNALNIANANATLMETRAYMPFVSVTPAGGNVPGRLWFLFSNSYMNSGGGGEVAAPAGATYRAGFEISGVSCRAIKFPSPSSGINPSATFGLGATTTNDPTAYSPSSGEIWFGYVDLADYALSAWPPSTDAWARLSISFPIGSINLPGALNAQATKAEATAQFATFSGTGDYQYLATGPLNTTNTLGAGFGVQPVAILGAWSANQSKLPSFGLQGDSIGDGTADANDTGTGTTSGGFLVRAARAAGFPYVKMTRGSDSYDTVRLGVNWQTRKMLYRFVTDLIDQMGLNGSTDATIASNLAYAQSLWNLARQYGVKRITHTAITATTSGNAASNSNWTSATVQAPDPSNLGRNRENQIFSSMVGSPNGIDAFVDVRTPQTDPANFNIWVSTGVPQYGTADGTHPSSSVHGFMMVPLVNQISRVAEY